VSDGEQNIVDHSRQRLKKMDKEELKKELESLQAEMNSVNFWSDKDRTKKYVCRDK
jgi:DNA gyrase/topoisomerase IV subunit A